MARPKKKAERKLPNDFGEVDGLERREEWNPRLKRTEVRYHNGANYVDPAFGHRTFAEFETDEGFVDGNGEPFDPDNY